MLTAMAFAMPFEIPGCTDSAACNYNDSATDDDGTCATLDECGVCGGNGIAEGACDCEGNTVDECGDAAATASPKVLATVRVHCLRRATIVLATA